MTNELTAAEQLVFSAVENELCTETDHEQAIVNAWGNRGAYIDGHESGTTFEEFENAFRVHYGWAVEN